MRYMILLWLAVLFLSATIYASPSKIEKQSLESNGQKRTYYLFVPDTVTAAKPVPLIVMLHGSGQNGSSLVEKWKDLANKEGIIIAEPNALDGAHWNIPQDGPDFLHDLIVALKRKYPVNARRVYLFGHSAGANGAIPLSFFESEYFAATAIHAGALRSERYALTDYAKRKIPFIIFVGTEDSFYPLATVRATRDALAAQGFPAQLIEIPKHTHDYYGRAAEINRQAWNFLKQQELPAEPQYTRYRFTDAQKQTSERERTIEPTTPDAPPTGIRTAASASLKSNAVMPDAPECAPQPAPSPTARTSQIQTQNAQITTVLPQISQADTKAQSIGEGDVVRINTSLVTVPASVKDAKGKYVMNLRAEDFHLYEDGVEQKIAFFSPTDLTPGDKPFNVALLLDVSDSTKFQLQDIQDAAIAFVDQLQPDDRVIIVSFDREVRVLSEATNNRETLHSAIRRAQQGTGGTSLYNAVDMTIKQLLASVNGRKSVVLFTDGIDTTSLGANSVSNIRAAEESGALVYAVQYNTLEDAKRQLRGGVKQVYTDGPVIFSTPVQSEKSRRRAYDEAGIFLRLMAHNTGARFFYADDLKSLAQSFTRIAESLRQQYILGYYPQNTGQPGTRHALKVTTTQSKLSVQARTNYIFIPLHEAGQR